MKKIIFTGLLPIALVLQGCASNSVYGPIRPIKAGNIAGVKSCPAPPRKIALLEDRFSGLACESIAMPDNDIKAKAMLDAGFSLVTARCNDYFAQKGGTQLGIRTSIDAVAPVIALLTGVLSITSLSSDQKRKNYESALSFGSVAALAGLQVYEDNFLFAADNIDDVRELTTTALKTHALAVKSLDKLNFDTALQYLIEHQMQCTPGRIKSFVKGAIKNGKFKAVDRNSGEPITTAVVAGGAVPPPVPAGTPILMKSD